SVRTSPRAEGLPFRSDASDRRDLVEYPGAVGVTCVCEGPVHVAAGRSGPRGGAPALPAVAFRGHAWFWRPQDDPSHPRPCPCRGSGKHRGPGPPRDMRTQGTAPGAHVDQMLLRLDIVSLHASQRPVHLAECPNCVSNQIRITVAFMSRD